MEQVVNSIEWTDISAVLGCGVYVLRHRGRVVFVGRAPKCMLARIAGHRALARKHVPIWSPIQGVIFDSVEVVRVHPDRLDSVYEAIYAQLLQRPTFVPTTAPEPLPCRRALT